MQRLGVQSDLPGADIFFQMGEGGCARDKQDVGCVLQQARERNLPGGRPQGACHFGETLVAGEGRVCSKGLGGKRAPGQVGDAVILAEL